MLNPDLERMAEHMKDRIKSFGFNASGELELEVQPDKLFKLLVVLKEEVCALFDQLIDMTAVDYLKADKRFKVVYNLLSLTYNERVRVITYVEDGAKLRSMNTIFPNAVWYEREVFDMFGIVFTETDDLRRILTDYNFRGHPLRKDFQLQGTSEVYFDEKTQKVGYRPL